MKKALAVLMPLEWLLICFGALIYALYSFLERPFPGLTAGQSRGPSFIKLYLMQFLTSLDVYALVALVSIMFRILMVLRQQKWRLARVNWGRFWKAVLNRFALEHLVQDARFASAVLIMFVEFALLKNLIPLINSLSYDELFISSDLFLCGGRMCSERLLSILGPGALVEVSSHYMYFFPYMSLVAFIMILQTHRRVAQEYLCAFGSLYLFGILWVYLLPTTGPAFVRPDIYSFMRGGSISDLQASLFNSRDDVFMISGFPSLHVAVVILGSLYLRMVHVLLAWTSWLFALLTLNSTIYLGWHYVLDDVGSVLLVVLSIWFAKRFSWRWAGCPVIGGGQQEPE